MPGAEAAKEVAVKGKDAAVKAAEVGEEKEEEVVGAPKTGGIIKLEGFGQGIETNDGESTTLAKLVEASEAGVVLFTYPKAPTPRCTKQAGMLSDAYEPLTATGLSNYGPSTNSPNGTLVSAIGFKSGESITRGVFVIDKSGNVLAADPGGPRATVDVVERLVETTGGNSNAEGILAADNMATTEGTREGEDELVADMVAEIADSAEIWLMHESRNEMGDEECWGM
ncbi:thioredoxin peroxidase dot5 [Friedmanniomyces endolithicus]|uniref:Alkyl hydroperoxide reductase subunit C/ Thiol specific antioxidant domain-containing protein n=1 Tax=Friedmanniomyces endolithicus TaxID=329885 RepID=A0A4U0U0F5_9PEZI|nr:thioredoxin peroxidase dot5 [Friedmanniomyces endolithicus]KAK0843724.1 thioredoxin peroxidase dot5 [Friedmanniomyces endolithicus]TKA28247.1 hypothetical protein B0A54_16939 [Friedmanniomyces endolithicus]